MRVDKEDRYKILDRVDSWINNCDTKSSFLLATIGIVFTILFSTTAKDLFAGTLTLKYVGNFQKKSILGFLEFWLLIAFLILKIKSLYHIYFTLKARIDKDYYHQIDIKKDSILFFGSISKKTFSEFQTSIDSEKEKKMLKDLNSQIYINSQIATEKFDQYNKSIISIFWSAIILGAYFFIIFLKD